jgi:hypothetical protein
MLFENGLAHSGSLSRAHAVPERDKRQRWMLGLDEIGESLDVGSHVMPGGDAVGYVHRGPRTDPGFW